MVLGDSARRSLLQTVLLAETDPRIVDVLPSIVSDRLPNVEMDICTSTEDLTRSWKLGTYDTIAISPSFLPAYRLLKDKADRHLFAPLLVTASGYDRELASMYLKREAFDLIIKPIIPAQAVQTVRLALWQNTLLKLLAAKERMVSRCQEHMNACPNDLRIELDFREQIELIDQTFHVLYARMRLILYDIEEQLLFDMGASLDQFTRQLGLARLMNLRERIDSLGSQRNGHGGVTS